MTTQTRKIKVVLGKVGFDPHDRGVIVLTHALRDAGMEVIFLGKFQTAERVVKAAIDEDADVIALSDHCGVMRLIATDVMAELKRRDATDIVVVAGGIIPEEDIPYLESLGVTGNYRAGTSFQEIIDHITSRVKKERWREV
ncbi:MAG TPA: methylmalonyl-CoA mutase [Dehalococcoidia bacterium]|jgi:methylmalonyl-CoA mutase C-terminal domain/subunit|nr:methylmalonyl-CoA mutase [Dehalococcoidia bacterium]